MDILLTYGKNSIFSDEDLKQIVELTDGYGTPVVRIWGMRSGAIDIVSALEISGFGVLLRAFTKPVVDAYLKGLINEEYFKTLGKNNRELIVKSFVSMQSYIRAFYKGFVCKKQDLKQSITLVESIGDCTLYVVLNARRTTPKLIEGLAESIAKTFSLITSGQIGLPESKIIQLFPNFTDQTWDYLFMPSDKAFGNFIDRYYSFTADQVFEIKNAAEFLSLFPIQDIDEYKILINPKNYVKFEISTQHER